jgi:hypothetical protein
VDIPDTAAKTFLDWDKPLSEQPKIVKDFLSKISHKPPKEDQIIGEWLKPRLNEGMAPYWSDDMRKAGIQGIQYLDQGSRATKQGTKNFVVFDPNIVKILERNDQPVKGLLK